MPDKLRFFFTDVFGDRRYSGNQLATFLNSGALSGEEMQRIAREINFSETTFILSSEPKHGGHDVRIFTPGGEVDFAGHPTLGTAYIIARHVDKADIGKSGRQIVLNLKVGQVPVTISGGIDGGNLWMQQPEPGFGRQLRPERLISVLNLNEDDFESSFPIEEVSTGLPTIIVPLKSMDALKRVTADRAQYFALVEGTPAKLILTFCRGGYSEQQALAVRVFGEALGIVEDPATGSGNGCLAAYLVRHRFFDSDTVEITVGQGYEIGRPSSLCLRAGGKGDGYRIVVGGRVIPIAEGWWG